MAAGVEVGGDGSVAWKVTVAHVRKGSVVSRTRGDYGYEQSGVDEAEYGQSFTIGIKIPREDGEQLAAALARAARDAEAHSKEPGYEVTFPLIIEPDNHKQIVISWESAPLPSKSKPPKKKGGKLAGYLSALAGRKKSGRKQTVKAVKKKSGKKKAGKKR